MDFVSRRAVKLSRLWYYVVRAICLHREDILRTAFLSVFILLLSFASMLDDPTATKQLLFQHPQFILHNFRNIPDILAEVVQC